jgi:nucleoside-diphosphate kinase
MGHIGTIIARIERAGLEISMLHMWHPDKHFWQAFYQEHEGKPFYNELVSFMASGCSVFMILRGHEAISKWRELLGATDPDQAEVGTIRSDFGNHQGIKPENAGHGSADPDAADREIRQVCELIAGLI